MNLIFKKIIPVLFLIYGIIIFFHPMILNPSLMPGDLGDARFVTYILEHGFLYVTNNPLHSSFWNPPFFYPYLNVLSYSDVLLGGMFIYIPLRFFISNPFSVIQIWFILTCILNFYSFYLVLRKIFKLSIMSSSIGAFVFAFSLVRYNLMGHYQFMLQFYSVFSFYFLFKKTGNKRINFTLSAVFLAIQFYTTFYLGYFTVFGTIVAILVLLILNNTRNEALEWLKNNFSNILLFTTVFFITVLPLMYHYFIVPGRFEYIEDLYFRLDGFLNSYSFLDSFFYKPTDKVPVEAKVGIGYFITLFSFLGLIKLKKFKTATLLYLLTTMIIFGLEPIYLFFFNHFPIGGVIRVPSRVIFVLIPVFCTLLSIFFETVKKRSVFSVLLLIVLLESVPLTIAFN